MKTQILWEAITALRIDNEWMDVASVVPCEMELGDIRQNKVQTCFWADCDLGQWIKLETTENHIYYYPVNKITGIEVDGPSGSQ